MICDAPLLRSLSSDSRDGSLGECNVRVRERFLFGMLPYALELVDRLTVVLLPVFDQRFFPLVFGPIPELRSAPAKFVQRHAVTAGVGDSSQTDLDE